MKMRKRRFRRKLIYYPAAGAMALSSLLGVKKPSKIQVREQEESSRVLALGADTLGAMRPGVVDRLRAAWNGHDEATRPVPTLNISANEPLEEAFRHLQMARGHWDKGEYDQAGREADEVTRLLAYTPVTIDADKAQVRDELRMKLSQLVVDLNQIQHGGGAGQLVAAEPVGAVYMEMNKPVQREIGLYQNAQRATFIEGYQKAGAHMPFIQKKIAQLGLPKELGWLPLVESGFKSHAKSQVAALGLWQFMPATGDQMGLERDRWIDERMNPEQASEAALTYLKYLYNSFGDWNKALAAYNYGEGNIRKVLRRLRKDPDQVSFWEMTPRLPEETARYVPRFLAAVHIANDPAQFGFENLQQEMPQRYDIVPIEKQMDMDEVARRVGVEPKVLAELNPELLQRVTPPQKHNLRVPAGTGQVLLAQVADIPEYRPQPKLVVPVHSDLVARHHRTLRGRSGKARIAAMQASARARGRKSGGRARTAVIRAKARGKAKNARQAHAHTHRQSAKRTRKRA